jgi:hypothetical protein
MYSIDKIALKVSFEYEYINIFEIINNSLINIFIIIFKLFYRQIVNNNYLINRKKINIVKTNITATYMTVRMSTIRFGHIYKLSKFYYQIIYLR